MRLISNPKIIQKCWWLMLTIGFCLFIKILHDMHQPYQHQLPKLSLSLYKLWYYSLESTVRLIIGMLLSLVFSIIVGCGCAYNLAIRRVLLPVINFLESIPLLGFMTLSVCIFQALYPHNRMGLEWAAIIGAFTGQAWNMALGFYQSLIIVPESLQDMRRIFNMHPVLYFARIALPFALPNLIYNMMISQSAAWFALVGTESIVIAHHTIMLPGIGSYIQVALDQQNIHAIVWAIVALCANVLLLDILCFSPLLQAVSHFKLDTHTSNRNQISAQNHLMKMPKKCKKIALSLYEKAIRISIVLYTLCQKSWFNQAWLCRFCKSIWYGFFIVCLLYYTRALYIYWPHLAFDKIILMMALTSYRVALAILLSVVIALPLGMFLGLQSKRLPLFNKGIQMMAALPPDILYPIVAILLISSKGSLDHWCVFLIMIGSMWYILVNVIAGISVIPQSYHDVQALYRQKPYLYMKNILLPAVLAPLITGIISAAGGAWNADITAEWISWGNTTLKTQGLGAFIADQSANGDMHAQSAGIILMCLLVGFCIIFIWRPLYALVQQRYRIR